MFVIGQSILWPVKYHKIVKLFPTRAHTVTSPVRSQTHSVAVVLELKQKGGVTFFACIMRVHGHCRACCVTLDVSCQTVTVFFSRSSSTSSCTCVFIHLNRRWTCFA